MPDSPPLIDPHNGYIYLPDGGKISPDLSLDAFEENPAFDKNRTITSGVPWWSYLFSGGRIDDKKLLVSVHFYDQLLLFIDLTVSHYPPDQKDLSENIEADTKDFHDRLLEQTLGPPARTTVSPSSFPDRFPILHHSLEWSFPWGKISSLFDGRSCSSLIMVSYGNRREEAHEIDQQRRRNP
jgi:hypothetical protein